MSLSVPHSTHSSYPVARVFAAAVLFALTLHLQPVRAQQPAQQTMKLERIEFKGLERVKQDEALEKSGLKVGQSVTIDELDVVANNLLASGLFKNLSYNIKGTTDKAVLTPPVGVTSGTHTIFIRGTLAGDIGSYGGTLNVAAPGVPEPATWAMMILGFGMVGVGMRLSRKAKEAALTA